MNKIMKLVLDIMKLAVEIYKNTKTDVFVEYAGHVDLLSVRIYKGGWIKNKKCYSKNVYLDVAKHRTEEDIIDALEEIYAELRRS